MIASRESLSTLPYSIEEIYGIRTSGKYGTLKQKYHEFYHIYGTDSYQNEITPEMVITEDSNSGYQFFESGIFERYSKSSNPFCNGKKFNWIGRKRNKKGSEF